MSDVLSRGTTFTVWGGHPGHPGLLWEAVGKHLETSDNAAELIALFSKKSMRMYAKWVYPNNLSLDNPMYFDDHLHRVYLDVHIYLDLFNKPLLVCDSEGQQFQILGAQFSNDEAVYRVVLHKCSSNPTPVDLFTMYVSRLPLDRDVVDEIVRPILSLARDGRWDAQAKDSARGLFWASQLVMEKHIEVDDAVGRVINEVNTLFQ